MKTKPIRILQLNTNRSNQVCHTLLNAYISRFDLILVTEPWWDKIGTDQIGPVSHTAWTPILPVASVPRGQRPRVMAYVKTRPDFTVTLRSDIAKDLDIQILDIQQANYPTTTIVNIYSQPRASGSNARRSDASVRLQALRLPQEDPVIISGDWNQHHPDWSITNRPS
ncbi:Endonuclease/exonuclease/phosphatase, partial [Lyophyllum atratum]